MTDPTLGDLMPAAPRRRRWPIPAAVAAAVVLLLAAGITAAYALTRPSDAERAEKACTEEYVPARLKTPTTAQYSGLGVELVWNGERHRVYGSVDAQNEFGAMVRMTFECDVEVTDAGVREVEVIVSRP
jgi:hypothetical protein